MQVILLGRIWCRKGLSLSCMKVLVSFQFTLFPMHEHEYCSNPGGWSSWLGSRSQGVCIGLDWVCSPVRVLLPAPWKEFSGPALYLFVGPPTRTAISFWLKALRIYCGKPKKKEKKKEHEYCSRISTTKTRRTANGDSAVRTFTATLPSSSSTLKHFYLSPPLAFLSLFSAIYFFQHMLFICLWISYFLYHRHGIIWYQIPSYFQEMGLASIFYTSTLH